LKKLKKIKKRILTANFGEIILTVDGKNIPSLTVDG